MQPHLTCFSFCLHPARTWQSSTQLTTSASPFSPLRRATWKSRGLRGNGGTRGLPSMKRTPSLIQVQTKVKAVLQKTQRNTHTVKELVLTDCAKPSYFCWRLVSFVSGSFVITIFLSENATACNCEGNNLHSTIILEFWILAEDIDPSVGRFRNMVQTAVIPIKVSAGHLIQNDSNLFEIFQSTKYYCVLSSLVTVQCISKVITGLVWLTVFSE